MPLYTAAVGIDLGTAYADEERWSDAERVGKETLGLLNEIPHGPDAAAALDLWRRAVKKQVAEDLVGAATTCRRSLLKSS